MLYAVIVKPLNSIFFVSERPDDDNWEVLDDVSLDAPPIYGIGRADKEPQDQILCVSNLDPKYFKVFINPGDIVDSDFLPTGRRFGGIFSKPSWERFAQHAPAAIATLSVEADEPPGATEEAVAMIKQGA